MRVECQYVVFDAQKHIRRLMARMASSSVTQASTCTIMLCLLSLIWLSTAADLITAWGWDNTSQPIAIYRSRPDLLAPILTPLEGIHEPERMAPGHFFVAPYTNMQPGIYIYDNNADLVYSSFGSYGAGPSHSPHVCRYQGANHLCFYQGVQHVGWGMGHGVIMDNHYRVVKSVEPSGTYQASSDMHEFYLTGEGETALMTQYVRSVYDLCPWGLCDGLGYIQAGIFQEIDVDTGKCLFLWNSIEHVDPNESYVLPSSTEISGTGESPEMPWDYFHINSVDKSSFDGGYLVSARHVCALYKIDGKSGEVMWKFGGKGNEYDYDNALGDVSFGFQHDARWISDSEEESVISIFDNASNGFTETARHSTGKVIRLNHKTKVASLAERPLDPPFVDGHAHLSKSQGNFQLNLPGSQDVDIGGTQTERHLGNRLMAYGNDPYFAEYEYTVTKNEETGQLLGAWDKVFYGALAYGYMMNYRVMKFDGWEGIPLTKPALWTFSQKGMNHTADNSNTMAVYVSWNGHTQIDTWTFYGTNTESAKHDTSSRDWEILHSEFPKGGFETIYIHPKTYKYVYAEAVNKDSKSLGKTMVEMPFTPNELMRYRYCDELACNYMDTNNPNRGEMREKMKDRYDAYMRTKDNGTEADAQNTYDDDYLVEKEGSGSGAGFALSFVALTVLVVLVFVAAGKRYVSVLPMLDRGLSVLHIKTRRREEARKGRYLGLDNEEVDVEDGDVVLRTTATRSSDDAFRHAKRENALQREPHSFWKPESP